jgi:hypothetical protein
MAREHGLSGRALNLNLSTIKKKKKKPKKWVLIAGGQLQDLPLRLLGTVDNELIMKL